MSIHEYIFIDVTSAILVKDFPNFMLHKNTRFEHFFQHFLNWAISIWLEIKTIFSGNCSHSLHLEVLKGLKFGQAVLILLAKRWVMFSLNQ